MTNSSKSALYFLLSFLVLATLASCMKEVPVPNEQLTDEESQTVTFRASCGYDYFAITEGPNSEIVHMEVPGYLHLSTHPLIATPANGDPMPLDDLKGIALFLGEYYVTTGPNNPAPYDEALLKIDPFNGTVLQHVVNLGMTVSDICFVDEQFGPFFGFVGLEHGTNNLAWIPYVGNGGPSPFTAPTTVPMQGLQGGHTATGLTFTAPTNPPPGAPPSPCPARHSLYVSTSSPTSNKAEVHQIEPISGVSAGLVGLIGGAEFQGANIATGWIYCLEEIQLGHIGTKTGDFNFAVEPFLCIASGLPFWANTYVGVPQNVSYEDFCTIPYYYPQ